MSSKTQTNPSASSILEELQALGDEKTKAMLMRNHGVREPCFGVKIGDMKPIVKRIKKDHQLALALYDTGNYDAQYFAGLIADDAAMSKALGTLTTCPKTDCRSGRFAVTRTLIVPNTGGRLPSASPCVTIGPRAQQKRE